MKHFQMEPYGEVSSNYPTPEMKELFKAIHSLDTVEEISNFFRDLLTSAELKEFANRWQIVLLLAQGISYKEIALQLNVSTTTVARCAYWLNHGMGGYEKIVKQMKHNQKRKEIKKNIPQNELDRTLQKIARLRK